MARKVGADSLASAIGYLLRKYGEEVDDALKAELQYAGEYTANEVHAQAQAKLGGTGKYAGGWDYAFTGRGGKFKVIVGNTTQPSLTHLLEKGHMNRDGSWTAGRPHMEPAYNKAVELLERRLNARSDVAGVLAQTGLPVVVADDPLSAVAEGTGVVMNELDFLARNKRES